jgi:hypothetical protein
MFRAQWFVGWIALLTTVVGVLLLHAKDGKNWPSGKTYARANRKNPGGGGYPGPSLAGSAPFNEKAPFDPSKWRFASGASAAQGSTRADRNSFPSYNDVSPAYAASRALCQGSLFLDVSLTAITDSPGTMSAWEGAAALPYCWKKASTALRVAG